MSKMKHLLRKLHIGGGINDHHHHQRLPPAASSTAVVDRPVSSTSTPVASSSVAAVDSVVYGSSGNGNSNSGGVDFNLLEEEFQVQLALAISVSDPDTKRSDPESVQIDAAKRISLGSVAVTDSVSDSIALRYWSYNVVNYTDKVIDGFYDVYGIASNSAIQGKMPLLVDLQAISILDNVDYEVVLVNRAIDPELQQLENKASMLSLENQVSDCLVMDGLIQKLAELVVDRMGGPVGDADEISTRWMKRSPELRNALNSIVIPLGRLDVGLSRHRALLFKVLADRINLPCMLVKGSYYTGTDDGAVNLIKIDNGSEYIIDLMGAPGTLIPAEVPSCHLLNTAFDVRGFSGLTETVQCSSLLLGQGSSDLAVLSNTSGVCQVGTSRTEEALFLGAKPNETPTNTVEMNQIQTFEQEFAKIFPSPQKSEELLLDAGRSSAAENIKVKNVSKYVISAAKNPGFAQKLHAVLLESGASPPPDLFSDMNQQDMGSFRNLSRDTQSRASLTTDYSLNNGRCDTEQVEGLVKQQREMQVNFLRSEVSWPSAVGTFPLQSEDNLFCAGSKLDSGEASAVKVTEMANHGLLTSCNDYNEQIHPMLGEVGEWEIPWEDLQIGERIGIGSYGEVYHADWNGTEVAVKKFLDQDLSGDALLQFKCEAEIMLRLRHPNVILFMGAVTRPPHLSILTEFLPRGSLYRLLHRPNPPLDEKRRLRMAIDVAKGMNYLHTSHPPIVHRDLKSPNLLVDKNWVVKVCDFGLSRLKHHTFLSSKSTAGTPEWMAPEVLRNEPANEKCDVYSFGVILWELTTCRIPWSGLNPMQVVGAVGFQNRRLEIPGDVDPAVTQIIHDCWQREPHLRPSFSQLISRLRLIQHLTSGGL